jgi:Ala-tRNA(Pro) deacylase
VKLDGRLATAVVPANHHVDTQLLKEAAGCTVIEIDSESEFAAKFPDCEAGAMPPFGNLYEMDVFVDERLSNDNEGLRSLILPRFTEGVLLPRITLCLSLKVIES